MMDWLLQTAGWSLVLLGLADLYITVLYARSDVGLLNARTNRVVWWCFRTIALRMPHGRARLLTFAGPTLLVLAVTMWLALLVAGFALIVWPALGSSVQATSGETPTDFATAVYYSGYTLATLGFGDIVPKSPFYRVLAVGQALVGFSVLTLSLTYFMSVYSALIRRNTLALSIYHRSGGDAAELLLRLSLDRATGNLALGQLNSQLRELYEAHHSYTVLHYFRSLEPMSEVRAIAEALADLAAIGTAITGDGRMSLGSLDKADFEETRRTVQYVLETLSRAIVPKSLRPGGGATPEAEAARWRARFRTAVDKVHGAGLLTPPEGEDAAARYVQVRGQWDPLVQALRRYMCEQE